MSAREDSLRELRKVNCHDHISCESCKYFILDKANYGGCHLTELIMKEIEECQEEKEQE